MYILYVRVVDMTKVPLTGNIAYYPKLVYTSSFLLKISFMSLLGLVTSRLNRC